MLHERLTHMIDPVASAEAEAAEMAREMAPMRASARFAFAQDWMLAKPLAMVSSFGADSVVMLHLLSIHAPDVTVLFVETGKHFPETLAYQRKVAEALGLTDIVDVRPAPAEITAKDPNGTLHASNAEACCALRKVDPLDRALEPFGGWFTGRKRFQSAGRAKLPLVEASGPRLKINPLADWTAQDLADHITAHNLPRHPLVARGYPSIGCAPCTARPVDAADPRSGRWAGQDKDECGIHFENGRIVRRPSGAARP